jgi:hypothetical protein
MHIPLVKTAFCIAVLGFCLAPSLGAATTGSLSLQGTAPPILQITVTAESTAASLPLNTTVTNLKVGTVVELSNDNAGYMVTLGSANALITASTTPTFRSSQVADFMPYTIQYGGVPVTFLPGGTATVVSNISAKTSAAGTVNIVTISFNGASAFLSTAIYSDTLTFSIIAK